MKRPVSRSFCRERPPWRSESPDKSLRQAAERHGGRSLQAVRKSGSRSCADPCSPPGATEARVWPALAAVLLTLTAATALAAERFPPPDFTSHRLPDPLPNVQAIQPRAVAWDYLDVGVLSVALSLASYFALVKRWRRGLLGLSIASLAWLGFWREGCVCPIGAIQNVTLALFDPGYAIPVSVVLIFALPLLFTFFFGRTFCASVCPLVRCKEGGGQAGEGAGRAGARLGVDPLRLPGRGGALRGDGDGLRDLPVRSLRASFFRRSGSINMLVFGGCLLVIGMFVGRPYCRFSAPWERSSA